MTTTKHRARERLAGIGLVPRGLSQTEAAAYIGVSVNGFKQLVEKQQMPNPRRIAGVLLWDRFEIDDAFTALPHVGPGPSQDDIWGDVS